VPRIIHVGLGPLGRRIAADVRGRGLGELVAAFDTDASMVGRTLEELGVEGAGPVRVSEKLGVAIDVGADVAVVTTASDLAHCAGTFRQLLHAGLSVVSTCEELIFPQLRHAPLAHELDAIAKLHGGRLLGTGVNPGFLMDALPLFATAVCREVRTVRVLRRQDATSRREPFQRKIGATLTPAEFESRVRAGTLRHVGLGESMFLLASGLGWTVDSWHETIEPVLADRPLRCALGEIQPGRAAGVRQSSAAVTADGRRIELEFIAAIGADDPVDRVSIEGDPPLRLEYPGGVHGDTATVAITLNAIPSLLASAPGLHTMATVPLVRSWAGVGGGVAR
jgi:4-hydroxy-tetrahydrodipicolinate reductase